MFLFLLKVPLVVWARGGEGRRPLKVMEEEALTSVKVRGKVGAAADRGESANGRRRPLLHRYRGE